MAFPARLLNEGEEVALDMRPHWWFFAGPGAAAVPLLALFVLALGLSGDLRSLALYALAVLALLWAGWIGVRLLRWQTTNFVVTSDRLVYRVGVLAKHGQEIPLERVNDISFSRTLWERIIGAGDLLIESAGERGQQTFSDIPHPDAVQQMIYQQIEANDRRSTGARDSTRSATIPEQIAQLADLRDRGALSDAAFEAKRDELLRRL